MALAQHPIEPCILTASLHRQRHEDEYTYVLESEIGSMSVGEVHSAWHGKLVFKHYNLPYTFWNAGDAPVRALEIISPAVVAWYFQKIAPLLSPVKIGLLSYEALRLLCSSTGSNGLRVYPIIRRAP